MLFPISALQRQLAPADDVVLNAVGELHKVGAEAAYPDDQIPVLLRVDLGVPQLCGVQDVVWVFSLKSPIIGICRRQSGSNEPPRCPFCPNSGGTFVVSLRC